MIDVNQEGSTQKPDLEDLPKEAHVLIEEDETLREAVLAAEQQRVVRVVARILAHRPPAFQKLQCRLPTTNQLRVKIRVDLQEQRFSGAEIFRSKEGKILNACSPEAIQSAPYRQGLVSSMSSFALTFATAARRFPPNRTGRKLPSGPKVGFVNKHDSGLSQGLAYLLDALIWVV